MTAEADKMSTVKKKCVDYSPMRERDILKEWERPFGLFVFFLSKGKAIYRKVRKSDAQLYASLEEVGPAFPIQSSKVYRCFLTPLAKKIGQDKTLTLDTLHLKCWS